MTLHYICEHGHKVMAPWPLDKCPGFKAGRACPGQLVPTDSAFRRRKKSA